MDRTRLKAQLKIDEAVRTKAYDDKTGRTITSLPSGGKVTLGVGWNASDNDMPENVIEALLEYSIDMVIRDLNVSKPSWRRHSPLRQEVLANMCFNMGMPKLKNFRKMWAALEAVAPNYDTAADEMLDSHWAIQVGPRAQRLAAQMRDNR
jgi:lysozyme